MLRSSSRQLAASLGKCDVAYAQSSDRTERIWSTNNAETKSAWKDLNNNASVWTCLHLYTKDIGIDRKVLVPPSIALASSGTSRSILVPETRMCSQVGCTFSTLGSTWEAESKMCTPLAQSTVGGETVNPICQRKSSFECFLGRSVAPIEDD